MNLHVSIVFSFSPERLRKSGIMEAVSLEK